MPITPYPEVDQLLENLLHEMRRILGAKLVGLYLYGSVVVGDFDGDISDVDLLAVTSSDVDEGEFERLREMHEELVAEKPRWENRIEVQYLSAGALQRFRTERRQMAVISPGEPFHMVEAGIEWLMNWYFVREDGVTLFGPSPGLVIPPIGREAFLQASREHAESWLERADRLQDRMGQSYAVLTLCRALYTSYQGERASKREAALWAQKAFPEWNTLIGNALVWRKGVQEEGGEGEATFGEAARFVRFAVERIVGR